MQSTAARSLHPSQYIPKERKQQQKQGECENPFTRSSTATSQASIVMNFQMHGTCASMAPGRIFALTLARLSDASHLTIISFFEHCFDGFHPFFHSQHFPSMTDNGP